MWPLIFRHAKRAFQPYEFEGFDDWHDWSNDDWCPVIDEQPHAIYQLLAIGRGSFVRLLIDRKRTKTLPIP
jgi:hypothetical protein